VPDDEDSISSFPPLATDATAYSLSVSVFNTTGGAATLIGWVDFNRDGIFQPVEGTTVSVPDGATNAILNWAGMTGLEGGATFARVRLTTDPSISTSTPGGRASNGEVEDYSLSVTRVPPTLNKAFSPVAINVGGVSTLTFTITNSFNNPSQGGVGFTDTFPAGVTIANPPAPTNSCAGTLADSNGDPLDVGGPGLSVSNASLSGGTASCVITVNVTSATPGSYTNSVANISGGTNINSSTVTPSTLTVTGLDFGDAPDGYGTTLAATGPIHSIIPGLQIGAALDYELDGQPTPNADGDDLNSTDDEDGVASFPQLLNTATSYSLNVTVVNTTTTTALLVGWIDFNRNNTFEPGEG